MKCRCLCLTGDKTGREYLLNNHPMKFHMYPTWFKCKYPGLDRQLWEVFDLDLWFESNMGEGVVLITRRVSKNSRYMIK